MRSRADRTGCRSASEVLARIWRLPSSMLLPTSESEMLGFVAAPSETRRLGSYLFRLNLPEYARAAEPVLSIASGSGCGWQLGGR